MNSGSCSPAGSRVSLRGVERMVSAINGVSTKIAHSMLVRCDTMTLLRFLPTAVLNTFNMHPRMRALQLQDRIFSAEIQAPLTPDNLTTLLRVRMLSPADYGDGTPTSWQSFVEKECSVGFDRHSQLPFYLSVWVAKRKGTARLMLFSDQYMSDGLSGAVVLNCILEQVSMLARQTTTEHQTPNILPVKEFPLRPSLYRMWLKKLTWAKPLLKGTNALFGRRMFRGNVHRFTSLLPAREDQKDFAVPPVTNSTRALFAEGEAKCMHEALARCKKEGVALNGVVVVVMLLAFYRMRGYKEQRGRFNPFRITLDIDCNMRQHVQSPADEDQVGLFTATTTLDWLTLEGVDMLTTCFWDLCGRATREIDANLKNTMAMALPTITADQKLNARMEASFLKNISVPSSIISDVGVAEVMQYPFEKHHSLTPSSDTASQRHSVLSYKKNCQAVVTSERAGRLTRSWCLESTSSTRHHLLSIESLHVFKTLPHLAPSVTIFLSSVNAFAYSMAHKVDAKVGQNLFTAFVLICESLSEIQSDEHLMDVLARLDEGDKELL
ncbi:hypothetical protein KXD40_005172 [Peronospora effusa]|uniref:Condensation domain-containing protein n=1 Tax=Peronospora effusa TaxID=542832 RepID=A0A3M6VS11_9STRA|nr:hypothetical protein DD238_001926 [Peronospora effusa]RQM18712.1 hypothetical protein DD237_000894 [Peronospora effusa]UIZ22445.1 hypothetical protein KXD40_005172 [Peronospora effusa]CAI5702299.1 unnamed protein product [Peronospora effusa]